MALHSDSQLVVAVGIPLPDNRNDCKAYGESDIEHTVRNATVIADSGYREVWKVLRDCPLPGGRRS